MSREKGNFPGRKLYMRGNVVADLEAISRQRGISFHELLYERLRLPAVLGERGVNSAYFFPFQPQPPLSRQAETIENRERSLLSTFPFGKWLEKGLRDREREEDPASSVVLIGEEELLPNLDDYKLKEFLSLGGHLSLIVREASPVLVGRLKDFKTDQSNKGTLRIYESDTVESTSYAFVVRESGAIDIMITPDILTNERQPRPSFFLLANEDDYTMTKLFNEHIRGHISLGRELSPNELRDEELKSY